MANSSWAVSLAESGWIADSLSRFGIRQRCKQVLVDVQKGDLQEDMKQKMTFVERLRESDIAIETAAANQQHYEVPTEFFTLVLGKNMKYSSCYYDSNTKTLDEAEDLMLLNYCEKAQLKDGMDVMDLGCGWGSVTFFVASKYPNSKVTSVSNSVTQREYIEGEAKKRGLKNIQVITADVNTFDQNKLHFDRIISVEMFEHMKNYEKLLEKISRWLKPDGMLFIHYFSHKDYAYDFTKGNWMTDFFFSGGTMPSDDLMLYFQKDLQVVNHWRVNGQHYEKTSNDWLKNMDKPENQPKIREIFGKVYGEDKINVWVARWRLFFLACAELFGYNNGTEWIVSLYLFKKK